jgi:PAS domain S-box-containing protein
MSGEGDKAAWGELLAGPPLNAHVRAALARSIVRWVEIPLWLLTLAVTLAVLIPLGLSAPSRLAPSVVSALSLLYMRRFTRQERWIEAAAMLSGLMFVAIAAGVLLNGVHAPVYAAGLILLVLVVPLFGARVGLLTLAALVLLGIAALGVEASGLRLVQPVSEPLRVALYACYGLFGLAMLAKTAQLLAEALHSAQREKLEAVTARAAEAATELAFHAVFDQATTGMLLLTAAGAIAQINAHAACVLGQSADALIGRSLDEAALWSSSQRRELRLAVSKAGGGSPQLQELTLAHERGDKRVYQLRLSPFYDQAGALGHVLVEVSDLTDLIATRTLLAEARRLEALGKLSGGLAHDINNMLAAVTGGSELARLGHEGANPQDVETGLEVVDSSVRRASSLIRQLLAFGSQDHVTSIEIDLNRLVRDMAQLFARTLHRRITVNIRTSDQPVWVHGDSAALENVLLNLALNAQDAMPEGGTLTFEVSSRTIDPEECAQLEQEIEPGPTASIRVSDTGTGMSPEVRERIFEPFFTTKPIGQGTGLGLSAVHGTVRNHRGAIVVHSRAGQGSSFELLLPATGAAEHEVEAPAHSLVAPKALHANVLLAEDEPLVRSIITKMLTRVGCQVRAVNDGPSLLRELELGPLPDLIMTDVMMPGLSGARLLSALEEVNPGCPLLLMTGYTGEDIRDLLTGRSRHQLLRKPFAQAELMHALEELLAAAQRAKQQRANA